MSESETELPEDYEDEVSPVVNEENEDELESQPAGTRVRAVPSADSAAETASLKAKNADLESRLGNALRVHGEKLKAKDQEIEEWLENVQKWHVEEANCICRKNSMNGL